VDQCKQAFQVLKQQGLKIDNIHDFEDITSSTSSILVNAATTV